MNSAVIVAGGNGTRLGLDSPKQFHNLCGKEMLSYSVETFLNHSNIQEVIIVAHDDWINHVRKNYPQCISVTAGKRRQDSSLKGVLATNINSENILIHDAARPFISTKIISDCISALENSSASAPILDSTNSLIELNESQISYVNRDNIKIVQTPQSFKRSLIINMLNSGNDGTDEIGILLKYNANETIIFVEGNSKNFKITTPADLIVATSILKNQ